MPKTSQRLETVLKLAKLKQQQAAERLGQCQKALDAQKQQMQQLESYQSEYNKQFTANANVPVSASQLSNYIRFFNNLGDAIGTQQQRAKQAENTLGHARDQWQQTYAREKNMRALVERKQQLEIRDEENKVQRMLDDRVVPDTSPFNSKV